MNILTILGSPKKKGKTRLVQEALEQKLLDLGHNVNSIFLNDYQLTGCNGCMTCIKSIDAPGCIQKDDTNIILDKIISSDAIIYCSPIYAWDFTAQMKLLLDRHFCFVKSAFSPQHKSFIENKKVTYLFTCMGIEGTPNTDLLPQIASRLTEYCRTNLIGTYFVAKSMQSDFEDRAEFISNQIAFDIANN